MKLEQPVIDALQASVKSHWTAIHFYTLLSGHCARLGFAKLAKKYSDDVSDEESHLKRLIFRLESALVAPTTESEQLVPVRTGFAEVLSQILSLETSAANIERAGISTACELMDDGTASVFRQNLAGSEDGIIDAETQISIIASIGIQNYLTAQMQ